ncbi:MAG: hypothetical protein MUC77_18995 [Chromatiaceae bacterium]|jgi:hypothetical protein|nr:hypothetical protein [Chromatiaceae bacterium]
MRLATCRSSGSQLCCEYVDGSRCDATLCVLPDGAVGCGARRVAQLDPD